MSSLCRLCLKKINNEEVTVELRHCQAFINNPNRINILNEICKLFTLEILDHNTLLHKICHSCDCALLSTSVFVENCLKSNDYFKSERYLKEEKEIESPVILNGGYNTIKTDANNIDNKEATQCKFCPRKFRKSSTLEKHMGKFHCNEPTDLIIFKDNITEPDDAFNSYQCDHCDIVFYNKQLLKVHLRGHEKSYVCHCGKSFKRRYRLYKHSLSIHSKDDSGFQCSECGKIFKSFSSLEYHQNIHRNLKPFQCNSCDESFYSPNSLKKHQRLIHCITKPDCKKQQFLCDNCGVSFSRRYHLKRHRLLRHTNPPLAFPCETCGKAFVDQSRLRAHLLIHTNQRDFECSECDRAFRTQSARTSHMSRVHLNLRPFPCASCEKAFKTKAHLKKHIRTHTGEKPFACLLCPYLSAELSNLKKHLKIHDRQ